MHAVPPALHAALPAPPVGARRLEVRSGDRTMAVLVLYPATDVAPEAEVAFGPYTLAVAMDAVPRDGLLPVALISHGNGGSPLTHRGTALALTRAGFVVVLPEHVGNSRSDGSLTGHVELLRARPRQVVDAIAALHADPVLGPIADPARRVLIGHSIGAYTVLAAAGGVPVNTSYDTPVAPPARLEVAKLDGVLGLVLLAPAAGWFMPPARLDGVTASVLLYRGAEDPITPAFHAEIVRNGLTSAAEVREIVVPGAGHYSFQTPFPSGMRTPGFPPGEDPPGFDREAFHPTMNVAIVRFAHAVVTGIHRD